MKNYYTEIGATPNLSTEEIKKCIEKKKKEISKEKIGKKEKKEKEKYLKEIKLILTNYHKRRDYDNYLYFNDPFSFKFPEIKNEEEHFMTERPNENYYFTSNTSSFLENTDNGYILYEKNYRNENGKEEKKEKKYFIDIHGKKTLL